MPNAKRRHMLATKTGTHLTKYLQLYIICSKGYAPAIAGIWGGVGEGLLELKFSSIILSFKTSRC